MNESELLARIENLEKEVQSLKEIIAVLSKDIEIPEIKPVLENPEIITTFYKLNDDEVKSLTSVVNPDFEIEDNILIEYTGNDSEVTIPYGITEIGDEAFYGCKKLKNVIIPESVTKIGEGSFSRCYNMLNIDIPDSVTEIGKNAFYKCKNLTISIPEDCLCHKGTFDYCEGVICRKNKKVNESIDEIKSDFQEDDSICGENAFLNGKEAICKENKPKQSNDKFNSQFKTEGSILVKYTGKSRIINIPDGITEIGEDAFFKCEKLVEVNIPESVTKISKNAFMTCSSLMKITIPYGVAEIGEDAFSCCSSLKEIHLPDSITEIGEGAFSFCDNLERVSISKRLTKIGDSAFLCCKNLVGVYIPSNVKEIGSKAFAECKNLVLGVPKSCKCKRDSFKNCKQVVKRR